MLETTPQLVLVVDDDAAFRALMRVLLEHAGFRVDNACDGMEAINMMRSGEYAAVLLDLMMPRLNGFEVLWHLKALQPRMLDRVVIMTAASDATLRSLDRELVHSVLRKPFDISAFISVVSDCSGRMCSV
jgi:CheY-like chemotaxis protein